VEPLLPTSGLSHRLGLYDRSSCCLAPMPTFQCYVRKKQASEEHILWE